MSRPEAKEHALELRRKGWTYGEIRAVVPVAKSTLSVWFRAVGLSEPQIQRITEKRRRAGLRGAQARRHKRLLETDRLVSVGCAAVGTLTARELWLIGTALYWAEGSKQNQRSVSTGLIFWNMDSQMVRVYLEWLTLIGVRHDDVSFSLYVHKDRAANAAEYVTWWANVIHRVPEDLRVYFKKGNPMTNRTNCGDLYHGLLRIKVRTSTILNRKVSGWTAGIVAALGSGVTGNTSAFEAEDSRIVP
jgi:hypothetical protein